jgi:hypothetical protein
MRQNSRSGRRGAALMWTVVVLATLTTFLGLTVQHLLSSRRQLERREETIQATWLARAGFELACDRLLGDPSGYTGETVELLAAAPIAIKVQAAGKDVFRVTSTARFRSGGGDRPVPNTLVRRIKRSVDRDRVRLEVLPSERVP